LGIFLFDVMGHGMESVQLKAEAKRVFGQLRHAWYEGDTEIDFRSTSDVMTKFNRALFEPSQACGMFITALLAILDPVQKTFTYTSAGHDPPILIKSRNGYKNIEETDLLIGPAKEVDYSDHRYSIEVGYVVDIYSDGIIEAGDPDADVFERHSVCQAISASKAASSAAIVESIFKRLRGFLKGGPLTDDCTLAVMKVVDIEQHEP